MAVAERVLSRRRLQLGGSELSITPAPVLPKADDRLVHIHGIGPDLDEETLEMVLESKAYGRIEFETLTIDRENGQAIATYSEAGGI